VSLPIAPIGSIAPLAGFGGVSPTGYDAARGGAAAGSSVMPVGQTTSAANFASALANGFDAVQAAQTDANQLAVQAATGQLVDPAQLTIATTKAQLMTQMASAIQSKAVTAFNTIMSMQA
jgi:flagellar hook-basal body complex protein FliE